MYTDADARFCLAFFKNPDPSKAAGMSDGDAPLSFYRSREKALAEEGEAREDW